VRAVLALALSLLVTLAVVPAHVHADGHGGVECAACAVRTGEPAAAVVLDLAPQALPAGEAPAAPGLAPVTGAPLGAVPGQSPPRA